MIKEAIKDFGCAISGGIISYATVKRINKDSVVLSVEMKTSEQARCCYHAEEIDGIECYDFVVPKEDVNSMWHKLKSGSVLLVRHSPKYKKVARVFGLDSFEEVRRDRMVDRMDMDAKLT